MPFDAGVSGPHGMRLVTVVLVFLLVSIQYPLWWGHGGWLRVHELQDQLAKQQGLNGELKARNDHVQGEVDDLRSGTAAIEERARYELGMVKDSEVFVQFVSPAVPRAAASATANGSQSTRGAVSVTPFRAVPDPAPRARSRQRGHPPAGGAIDGPAKRSIGRGEGRRRTDIHQP